MSDEVQWEQPGVGRTEQSRKFADLAQQLKKNPGRWAIAEEGLTDYRTQAAVKANQIKKNKYLAFPQTGFARPFDATTRKGVLYVRWVGHDGEHADVED